MLFDVKDFTKQDSHVDVELQACIIEASPITVAWLFAVPTVFSCINHNLYIILSYMPTCVQ